MCKQVNWNKSIVDTFTQLAMLNDLEHDILETRVKGMTITQQAFKFGLSERSVNRIINSLKEKYDRVQPLSDGVLPIRRKSKQEEYMDTH